jgi:hypothetical protein
MNHLGYNVIVNGKTAVCYPLNLGVNGSLFPEDNKEDETAFASAILAAKRHVHPFTGGLLRPVGLDSVLHLLELGHTVDVSQFPACKRDDIKTLKVVKNTFDTTY